MFNNTIRHTGKTDTDAVDNNMGVVDKTDKALMHYRAIRLKIPRKTVRQKSRKTVCDHTFEHSLLANSSLH
jgi:hypothetical protein